MGTNKILLVDNEPDIAVAFKIGLEDNGFAVDAYNDPLEALSNFNKGYMLWHYWILKYPR
jgi:DNA-binding response OmpR family regulator